MPFVKGEVPPRLKGKGIPQKFVDQFVEVFNSVYERTKDEGAAYQQAYGVMRDALKKAGYAKADDGKWHKEEKESGTMIYEGWLPQGVGQNSLDDGDFAWLSAAYSKASAEERKGMNKREHRKLPFKIHGKTNREGWKAAWKAAAHPGARHPSFEGGPSQAAVMATLRRYKPRGITLEKDNSFTDSASEDTTLSASARPLIVLEEVGDGGGLTFKGVALIDEAVSANGRYYSAEFNDRCMAETNGFIAGGGIVTIYSRHGKALGADGQMPTELPVGRIKEPLFREGKEICYIGYISPTMEGRDCITLIRDGIVLATSIRSTDYESRSASLNDMPVEEMVRAVIAGVDLTDEAGIRGAGIKEILEEAPHITQEKEVEDMELKDLTLEQLRAERADLLTEFAATLQADSTAKIEDATSKVTALETERAALNEKMVALEADRALLAKQVQDLELAIGKASLGQKVAEASIMGSLARIVHEELTANVKVVEDIPRALKGAREKALTQVAMGATASGEKETDPGTAKGKATVTEEAATEEAEKEEPLTEEFQKILALSK